MDKDLVERKVGITASVSVKRQPKCVLTSDIYESEAETVISCGILQKKETEYSVSQSIGPSGHKEKRKHHVCDLPSPEQHRRSR